MAGLKRVLELLYRQRGVYGAMLELARKQKLCIENEDLPGLEAALGGMHEAIVEIQLRQVEMPVLTDGERADRKLAASRASVEKVILEVEELRSLNERALVVLLGRTKQELNTLGQGRRATQVYKHSQVGEARFLDRTK